MKTTSGQWQRSLFVTIWAVASIFLGWQLVRPPYSLDSPLGIPNLIVMFLCTVALLVWISNPIQDETSERPTRKGLFVLFILLSFGILFAIRNVADRGLMFGLPVIALLVLILLKRPVDKREVLYALVLAGIAGITGFGAGWITFVGPLTWGILQVLLVLTGLLAGWSILRSAGLQQQGVGTSRFLSDGVGAALRSFLIGLVIALPWSFLNVLLGSSNGETWVKAWWQPFIAIQPGIAEEAWGRIMLVPLLFLLFRRVSRPRAAFTAALYVVGFWFAYLHTQGGVDGIAGAMLIGTLYSLPVSYLCLYRDLETAIGWHFWVDFVKFVVAFILFNQ